jgi:DNA polymerase elongation subunit (family B)
MTVLPQDRTRLLKQLVKDGAVKLLFMDCETAPMQVWTHYIGQKVSIYPDQVVQETNVICIQYMYEGDTEVSYLEWDQNGSEVCDAAMIEEYITKVHNAPDTIVIGQNHKSFDTKVLNERAVKQQLTPMNNEIIHLDVLSLSRGAFRFPSHKLDFRSKVYGFGGKIKMEMQDWIDIRGGNKKKLAKMIEYGCKDITDLRSIFWRELPYYSKLPAPLEKMLAQTGVYCQRCANNKQAKFDVEEARVNKRKGYKCNNCCYEWELVR